MNDGPFIVCEGYGVDRGGEPFGRTYFYAYDAETGIGCAGRLSRGEADADAKALNAAYLLGKQHQKDIDRDANRGHDTGDIYREANQ